LYNVEKGGIDVEVYAAPNFSGESVRALKVNMLYHDKIHILFPQLPFETVMDEVCFNYIW
jgi:hypothetical protein